MFEDRGPAFPVIVTLWKRPEFGLGRAHRRLRRKGFPLALDVNIFTSWDMGPSRVDK